MTSRENILQKLRASRGLQPSLTLPAVDDRSFFRDFPEPASERLLALFAQRLTALKGEFYAVGDANEAAAKLRHLLESAEDGPWIAQSSPLLDAVLAGDNALAGQLARSETLSVDSSKLAQYSAGVSVADALVARTGSIVLRSTTAGGRRLSVLPPLHIVLAQTRQIVPSLDAALASMVGTEGDWSYTGIITGPSRTADIEKILVLGAHGPKRLAVVLLP